MGQTEASQERFKLLGRPGGMLNAVGFHKYDPLRTGKPLFLDVADSQYDLREPSRIVFTYNPATNPGKYGVGEVVGDEFKKHAIMKAPWDSSLEFYVDYENDLLYLPNGENRIEVREFSNLSNVKKTITTGIRGITGITLDSQDRLWAISSRLRGGDGGLYVVDKETPHDCRRKIMLGSPTSIDSMRIAPWGQKIFVADPFNHRIVIVGEEGEQLGFLATPYPTGIKTLVDERVIISSGKIPTHVDLTIISGGLHNVGTNWFAYLTDYGTQASNRADAVDFHKILIQWFLGFQEVELPLRKEIPFVTILGTGIYNAGDLIMEKGFNSFTPIFVGNHGSVYLSKMNAKFTLEMMEPASSIIAGQKQDEWIALNDAVGRCKIEAPGIYRVRAGEKFTGRAWAITI